MNSIVSDIRAHLQNLKDEQYRLFQIKLIPGIDPGSVIGVRTPALRAYAKMLFHNPEIDIFLHDLPHRYYEETVLHGLLLEKISDYEAAVLAVDNFLPYVTNWAVCDTVKIDLFKKNLEPLLKKAVEWIHSDHVYTIRFGIGILMRYFLDDQFTPAVLKIVADIQSEEYYVNMMIAWFFATALAKHYAETLPYIENKVLDPWTHNKTIQKARESFRVTASEKAFLSTLRVYTA
jgi:3-methyladenine DNA glycosylase AlkD